MGIKPDRKGIINYYVLYLEDGVACAVPKRIRSSSPEPDEPAAAAAEESAGSRKAAADDKPRNKAVRRGSLQRLGSMLVKRQQSITCPTSTPSLGLSADQEPPQTGVVAVKLLRVPSDQWRLQEHGILQHRGAIAARI